MIVYSVRILIHKRYDMEITTAANIFWELPSYAFMKC